MYYFLRPPWLYLTAVAFLVSGQQWTGKMAVSTESGLDSLKQVFVAPENADYAPQPLNLHVLRDQIGYPAEASAAGIEGEEVFKVFIDTKGQYLSHESTSSSHPLLRIACEDYLNGLRCMPAEVGGKYVNSWTEVRIAFVQ